MAVVGLVRPFHVEWALRPVSRGHYTLASGGVRGNMMEAMVAMGVMEVMEVVGAATRDPRIINHKS